MAPSLPGTDSVADESSFADCQASQATGDGVWVASGAAPQVFESPPRSLSSSRQSSTNSLALLTRNEMLVNDLVLAHRQGANNSSEILPANAVRPGAFIFSIPDQAQLPPFNDVDSFNDMFEQPASFPADEMAPVGRLFHSNNSSNMASWVSGLMGSGLTNDQLRQDVEAIRPIFQDERRLGAVLKALNEERLDSPDAALLDPILKQPDSAGFVRRESTNDSVFSFSTIESYPLIPPSGSVGTAPTDLFDETDEDERTPAARAPLAAACHPQVPIGEYVTDSRPWDGQEGILAGDFAEARGERFGQGQPAAVNTKRSSCPSGFNEQGPVDVRAACLPIKREQKSPCRGRKGKKNKAELGERRTPQCHRKLPKEPLVNGVNVFYVTGVRDQQLRRHILCGRGGGGNGHPKNKAFREYCKTRVAEYEALEKNEKKAFVFSIVGLLQKEWSALFLAKDSTWGGGGDRWYEIVDEQAREKVSQALREVDK